LVKQKPRGSTGPDHPQDRYVGIQLDPVEWEALRNIAAEQRRPVRDLVIEIARDSLGIAIRVYIQEFYRSVSERIGKPGPGKRSR
jgi:hypothetical protein